MFHSRKNIKRISVSLTIINKLLNVNRRHRRKNNTVEILPKCWFLNPFLLTRNNRQLHIALLSLHGGSPKITRTVPLKFENNLVTNEFIRRKRRIYWEDCLLKTPGWKFSYLKVQIKGQPSCLPGSLKISGNLEFYCKTFCELIKVYF